MAMYDLSQSQDPGVVNRSQHADVQQKEANVQKTMQEVFDLSVNNAVQEDVASYLTSPGHKKERSAESQMKLAKSMQVLDDREMNKLEEAFGAMGDNPSPEGYELIRDSLVDMNPVLQKLLPPKYSPDAMKGLQRVRVQYIKDKAHRQKLESMGFDRDTQTGMLAQKGRQDLMLLDAAAEGKYARLMEQINSNELLAGAADEAANQRVRMGLAPMLQMAERLRNNGQPDAAMAVLDQAAQLIAEANLAKARGTGPTQGQRDAVAVKLRKDQTDMVKQGMMQNYAEVVPSFNKDQKAIEASNFGTTTDRMLNKAASYGVRKDMMSGWVQERMILDVQNSNGPKWIEMPLNEETGELMVLGQDKSGRNIMPTASDILGSIGMTLETKAWKGREHIGDLEEALEWYDYRLKLNGHAGIYPNGSRTERNDAGAAPTA